MTQDDQAKYRVAEVLRNSLGALDKNRGRSSRLWEDLTSAEKETEADRIQSAIDSGAYDPQESDSEALALELATVNTLLGTDVGTELRFTVQPSAADTDTPIAPSVEVSLTDADGNVLTGFTGDVTVVKGDGTGVLSGTLTQAAVAGVASFDDLEFDAADDYTLVASSGNLSVESDPVTISAP